MKITLFLDDRLVEFILPNQISGSYGFDVSEDEIDKLINIDARNGKWILYSTDSVFVINNNNIVPDMEIIPNMFYIIRRDNVNYVIYLSDVRSRVVKTFMLPDQFTFTIGVSSNSNLCYSTPYLKQLELSISRSNAGFVLSSNLSSNVYINNKKIFDSQNYIHYGDVVNVMGIKMLFINKYLIINMPNGGVSFNNLPFQQFNVQLEENQNIIVKDVDLYDTNNYFSKSPRIRRLIELKDFSFDSPPKLKEAEKTPLILTLGPMLSLMASSGISLLNTIVRINDGSTTFKQSWMSFATCGVMLVTSFVWPLITRAYNKRLDKKNNKEIEEKYGIYLKEKEKELENESNLQKSILFENLLSCKDCLDIVNTKKNNFW